jgi:hypothetical protein
MALRSAELEGFLTTIIAPARLTLALGCYVMIHINGR